MVRMRHREWLGIVVSAALFLLAALALPWVGAGPIDVHRVLHRQAPDYQILLQLRVSRTLLALVAGGALSLAGTLFQAMLRDALATPYTLGISAGASLGAVVVIAAGWTTIFGIPSTWVGALAGALVVLLVVAGGSLGRRQLSTFTLLLTGIAINSVCAAFILILSGFAGVSRAFSITRWLIGSVDATSYQSLAVLSFIVALAAGFILSQARGWNLLAVGEQWAVSRGVRVARLLGQWLRRRLGARVRSDRTHRAHRFRRPDCPARSPPAHQPGPPGADAMFHFCWGERLLAACDAIGRVVLAPAEISAGGRARARGRTLSCLGHPQQSAAVSAG